MNYVIHILSSLMVYSFQLLKAASSEAEIQRDDEEEGVVDEIDYDNAQELSCQSSVTDNDDGQSGVQIERSDTDSIIERAIEEVNDGEDDESQTLDDIVNDDLEGQFTNDEEEKEKRRRRKSKRNIEPIYTNESSFESRSLEYTEDGGIAGGIGEILEGIGEKPIGNIVDDIADILIGSTETDESMENPYACGMGS